MENVPGALVLSVYHVADMDCPMEEALIRKKLEGMSGVSGLEFNFMRRELKVQHKSAGLVAITEALDSLNLGARLLEGEDESSVLPASSSVPWRRLVLAAVLAACSEVFAWFQESGPAFFGGYFGVLPVVLAIAAILLAGLSTYKKGWIAVRNFNLNINALMSVAVTGALCIGEYSEAAMVMVLFNLAEALEAKSLDRARNAIRELLSLSPEQATVLQPDGSWSAMDIRRVLVGSRVRVRPGEKVGLDGVILQGQSAVNQAPITGESMPVEKTAGDAVYAGTINESGSFEFEVRSGANDSTLARIIHAVEEAQSRRAPMQQFVDRFARYYTPAIFLAALLTALVPPLFLNGVWTEWIYTALVILVIACPCALVLSTPVSIVSAMSAATRHGMLIKGGIFLEQGRLLQWLALDKTGTLTHGKPRQTDIVLTGILDTAQAQAVAASLAIRSDHPVSRAIAAHAGHDNTALFTVEEFTALPGQGLRGIIEGRVWHMGNRRLLQEYGLSPECEKNMSALEEQGKSVVALFNEQGVQALVAVADTLKESSMEAIAELRNMGVKTVMLSGDNEHSARTIARQVGVDEYRANLLPEDKLREVERLAAQGKVGMVGDGINDAPALARADIGFAMAVAGTDSAMESADVALMDDDLRKIPRFIRLSRATYAILVQNIVLALGIKIVFLGLTFAGLATMWMAVFADVGTSLLVVANGLRAMRN